MAAGLVTWPFILSGARRGLSGAATLRSIRASGFTIGNEAFGELFRRASLQESLNAQLRFIRRDFRPNPQRLAEAITRLSRRFVFTVRIRGINRATGKKEETFVNVATDDLLTRGDIETIAGSRSGGLEGSPPIEPDEITLVGGVKSGQLGTIL